MKTKKFFMVLVALFMGSQMAIFAQGKKEGKTDRKQFGQEQMQKMQCKSDYKCTGFGMIGGDVAKGLKPC